MARNHSRRRWDRAAQAEPYYSVLSQPRFLTSRMIDNPAPFFESGEADVEKLMTSIRAVDRDARVKSVLEFGCGPGRLIPAFLQRGIAVTAVDISPRMLAIAAENTTRAEAAAVFVEESAFAEDRATQFDLVVITRVLQHIGAANGADCVRRLAQRVRRGGFLYLDFPFRSTRSALSHIALELRASVPVLNTLANAAKRRPLHAPVSPVQVHSLDTMAMALQESGLQIVSITTTSENELTTASILARASGAQVHATSEEDFIAPLSLESPTRSADAISPADLIRTTTLEDLSALAEQYFARMDTWDSQLAKPFASPTDAPAMLISLGTVLHGMHLSPGMTVLDFGGGTGWLSRALSQLGCRVILCDVSPTALRIARKSIEENPPIGASEEPQYLLFDGRKLDLPDESVDRILCFDSFHHVPNPEPILREFGRILRPGALAAFSEPGPHHSQSAQSQFEMRVHGVLENDIDLPWIWKVAKEAGFDDLRVGVFDGTPVYLPLDEFDELLAGGSALRGAAKHMRDFTANVRTFTMRKRGEEALDSRTAGGLLCRLEISLQDHAIAGEEIAFTATAENIGTSSWLPSANAIGGVSLGAHLYQNDHLKNFDFAWIALTDETLPPGAQTTVHGKLPPLSEGRYAIEFDCVANRVTWFEQAGSTPVKRVIEVSASRHRE